MYSGKPQKSEITCIKPTVTQLSIYAWNEHNDISCT